MGHQRTPTWSLSLVATPDGTHYVSTPDLAFDHYGTPSVSYSFASLSTDIPSATPRWADWIVVLT